MSDWRTVPQPDDPHGRVKEGDAGEVRLLWGGRRRNTAGDNHGDLISPDGLNAEYLRLPGGELVVDKRQDAARAILDEARRLDARSPAALKRLAALRAEWAEDVEAGGSPGRQLAEELRARRAELRDIEQRLEQESARRQRRRDRQR